VERRLDSPEKKDLKLNDLEYDFQIIKEKLVYACRTMLSKSKDSF